MGVYLRRPGKRCGIPVLPNDYIRESAQTSPVDELHKLADLKERGAISADEYDQAKAKYLS